MIEIVQKYPIETIEVLLIIISILLFCLLSPNIVIFIHKRHFKWQEKEKKN